MPRPQTTFPKARSIRPDLAKHGKPGIASAGGLSRACTGKNPALTVDHGIAPAARAIPCFPVFPVLRQACMSLLIHPAPHRIYMALPHATTIQPFHWLASPNPHSMHRRRRREPSAPTGQQRDLQGRAWDVRGDNLDVASRFRAWQNPESYKNPRATQGGGRTDCVGAFR